MTTRKPNLIGLVDALEALTSLARHTGSAEEDAGTIATLQKQIDAVATNFALVLVALDKPVTVYPSDRERLTGVSWRIESDALPEERQRFRLVIDKPQPEPTEPTATTDEKDRRGLTPVPPERSDA